MNNRPITLLFGTLILLATIGLSTRCNNDTRPARVVINLGEQGQITFRQNRGLLQMFLAMMDFLTTKAMAAVPSNIESIKVSITASDMSVLEASFAPTANSVELFVPAGSGREIRVRALVKADDPGAVLSFGGKVVVDLEPGESKEVDLNMVPYETKLVMADYIYSPRRIIQVNDISGTGYTTLTGTNIDAKLGSGSWTSYFAPYDVAFDSKGRILIANYSSATGYGRVLRVDNIAGDNPFAYPDKTAQIYALAVDYNNGYVYYATSTVIYRNDFTGSAGSETTIISSGISNILGMAVDDRGNLIVIGYYNTIAANAAIYIDTASKTITNYYNANLNNPWHVLVKSPNIYIANASGASGYKIIQLDSSLRFVKAYGNSTASVNTDKGMFYAPRRFLAIRNDKITILDDLIGVEADKLVSMDDIDGTNWETYPKTGNGQSLFHFYTLC